GERGANSVYADIITRIAAPKKGRPPSPLSVSELIERLETASKETAEFSRFGLISPFNADEMVRALRLASKGKVNLVRSILLPYVDGVVARLQAMRPMRDLIATFIDTLNEFYVDK